MAEQTSSGQLPENQGARPRRQKRNLMVLTVFLLVIGAAVGYLYWTDWRFHVETEDAYVNGDLVQITAQAGGTVLQVNVEDTQPVNAGDVLVQLDKRDAILALDKAKSQLAAAVREYHTRQAVIAQASAGIAQAQAQAQQAKARVSAAEVSLQTAQADYAQRRKLSGSKAISEEDVRHSKAAVSAAQAELSAAKAALLSANTQIENARANKRVNEAMIGDDTPLREQPAVQAAISAIRNAWLNLERSEIRAPIQGIVARKTVQPGQKIAAGVPLMAVVPLQGLWVDANFKESQLAGLYRGQKVTLISDMYGDDVVFHGVIQGISAGTGSAFSVLPAQNATGNWIKVVQRVPVRIALDEKEVSAHPLRIGLTMRAEIDTREHDHKRLSMITSLNAANDAEPNWQGANQIIDELLNGH